MNPLDRFVAAQRGCYAQALAELAAGNKRTHWIWFIFPQIAGLGQSATARHYALADLTEARDYLAHPVLGDRLTECTEAMLGWARWRGADAILGTIDALKFRSSMTLFEAASGGELFAVALQAFYAGKRDEETLRILGDG
ncbi:MAG: DUF1810 domain-containing protein [Novosphingobium sp.]